MDMSWLTDVLCDWKLSLNKKSTNAHSKILKSTWLMHKLWIPLTMNCDQLENSIHTLLLENGRMNWLSVFHYQVFILENGTKYSRCEGTGDGGHNFHRIEHPVLQTIYKMMLLQMEKCILWNKQLTTTAELNTQIWCYFS